MTDIKERLVIKIPKHTLGEIQFCMGRFHPT